MTPATVPPTSAEMSLPSPFARMSEADALTVMPAYVAYTPAPRRFFLSVVLSKDTELDTKL